MKSLRFAFGFFTRLPAGSRSMEWDEENASASLAFLPLTGAVLGAGLVGAAILMEWLAFPQSLPLKLMVLLLLELLLGGPLFLDGFADSCDGCFAQVSPERALDIMKDSRIGAFGVIGLIFLLGFKLALWHELFLRGALLSALWLAPVWMRFSVVASIHFFPSAKEEGLAYFFSQHKNKRYFYQALLFLILITALIRWQWFLCIIPAFGFTFVLGRFFTSCFGGFTGDLYGMTAYAAEVLFLILCAAGQAAGL